MLSGLVFFIMTNFTPALGGNCDNVSNIAQKLFIQHAPETPLWKQYADEAEVRLHDITRLEREERKYAERIHAFSSEPSQKAILENELAKIRIELNHQRDALLALNKKNHALLNVIRTPDHVFRKIKALDQEAAPFREKLFELNSTISDHEVLVQSLSKKEREFARRGLDRLLRERELIHSRLDPIEQRIKAEFDAAPPELRLKQLTGKRNEVGMKPKNIETADPIIYRLPDGRVRLMGSGWIDREYASMDHMMSNIGEKIVQTDLRYPGGEPIETTTYGMGGPVWDKSIVHYENGEERLYASALSPVKYREGGKITDEAYTTTQRANWTRRIYAFKKKFEIVHPVTGEKKIWDSLQAFLEKNPDLPYLQARKIKPKLVWVRNEKDIWGIKVPMDVRWDGHSYGVKVRVGPDGKPFRDEKGYAYIEYEKVSSEDPSKLGNTYPYSQRLKNPDLAEGEPVKLMESEYVPANSPGGKKEPYPGTVRSFDHNLTLIEGPQTSPDLLKLTEISNFRKLSPEQYENFKATWNARGINPNQVSFKVTAVATNDYPTKDYGMNLGLRLVKENEPLSAQMGPLAPVVHSLPDGRKDITHIARDLGYKFRLSWGPSRPYFFKHRNQWWVAFHSVDETVVPRDFNPRVWPADERIDDVARNAYISPAEPVILPDGQVSFHLLDTPVP